MGGTISTSFLVLTIQDNNVIFYAPNNNQYNLNISVPNLYGRPPLQATIENVLMEITNFDPKKSVENGKFTSENMCNYNPDFNNVKIYIPVTNLSNIPIAEGGFYPPINITVYGILIYDFISTIFYVTQETPIFYPDNLKNPLYYIGTVSYEQFNSIKR